MSLIRKKSLWLVAAGALAMLVVIWEAGRESTKPAQQNSVCPAIP